MNFTSYIIIGLAVFGAAGFGWGKYQTHERELQQQAADALLKIEQTNLALATGTNDANVIELNKIKADLARQKDAATKFEAMAHDRAVALWKEKQRIANVPKTDDGPVARVLLDTIDVLRVVKPGSDAPADSADKNPTGGAADSGKPDVPAAANPPGS